MAFSSKNAFALLGDDDGPAPVAAAPKAAAPAAPAAAPRNVVGSGRGAPRGGAAAAGPRGGQRAPRNADAAAAGGAEDGQQTRDAREPRKGRGGDGRGRGRGGRGAKGGRLDRHSQTDRVDSEKNIHQGWGGDDGKRELKNEEDAVADANAEATPANGAATPATVEGDEAAPAAEAVPAEEVDNTKTLDEYLADMAAKKATLGGKAVTPRTVEGGQWEGFGNKVVKSQSGGDEFYAATKAANERKQRERKEKQTLDIEQTFNTPPVASRGGRGGARGGRGGDFGGRGRGEGRGRGARGAPRGARGGNAGPKVNLEDTRAFPSLS
ncbi:hypothetical protein BDZ90DRAFT_160292 [Jaminaea rosea]|uniref:Hyaluronan/mRNA-binding protein domain-containing protein n=1 Tax=Jaminaea rosea TaxID=1569628 RepID=A0A316UUM6_9BASI|nr:hypothetical protein BDZ90DRAFT_160292 [Jaminaea rosea]PWN28031.1 hypothetical protein BDZ90DRAFT_160292 [Jaminaea rosea]